jgi:hypothetical protein
LTIGPLTDDAAALVGTCEPGNASAKARERSRYDPPPTVIVTSDLVDRAPSLAVARST